MQILLATSPHVRHAAVLQSDFTPDPSVMYSFAPVGLLSLAAMLRQTLDLTPQLFDLNQRIVAGDIPLDKAFYRSAAERIVAEKPDVLGFMTECDSYHHVLQTMGEVKRQRPETRCVLGGPHASAVARATMTRHAFVDAVVIGEGEFSFPELVTAFAEDRDKAPPGTLMRGVSGALLDGGARPLAPSLDEAPIPAYDLYRGTLEEEIFIEAGRGCPFQCTFCSTAPFWQRRHRVKSPARILEEIRLVQRLYQSKRVHFTHDLLTTDKRWVADLCRTLIAAGTPIKWTCSARTDTVDRDLLALMAEGGCSAIYFGIESGSARILEDIQKDVPIERSLDVLHQCREVGIRPNAGFIAGFPTEDRQSLDDTFTAFERALSMGTRPTHIFGFCPFAASSLYPRLGAMTCDGHFVDIPIEPELDAANRALIASDQELYGSYFRPVLDVAPTRLQGVDEFSNLIEPVAAPALYLSRAVGGMLALFDRWTGWVERRNLAAGAPAHRRFYGSPWAFSEFVVEELSALMPADDPMLQLAQVLRTSLGLGARWAGMPATTMANHRSVDMPGVGAALTLGDRLRLNTMLATMRLDYDLVPLLDAPPDALPVPERQPTFLMWDLADDGRIRLSKVEPLLFTVLEQLQRGPQPVAALVAAQISAGEQLDYEHLIDVLTTARTLRLVETA